MRTKRVLGVLLILGGLLAAYGLGLAGAPAVVLQAEAAGRCQVSSFTVTVRQGPDAGLVLGGNLKLQIDAHGSVSGVLQRASGPNIPVVGQVNGRAINLAFTVAAGKTVYGVGTLQNDIRDCKGGLGGPAVGPNEGDSGDWLACFFCATPTPAPPHDPVIIHPTWNDPRINMQAAGSYIQSGAQLQVTRPGYATESFTLRFDTSGTVLVAGGPNALSTPGGRLMTDVVPPATAVTLVVVNTDGRHSAAVTFSR